MSFIYIYSNEVISILNVFKITFLMIPIIVLIIQLFFTLNMYQFLVAVSIFCINVCHNIQILLQFLPNGKVPIIMLIKLLGQSMMLDIASLKTDHAFNCHMALFFLIYIQFLFCSTGNYRCLRSDCNSEYLKFLMCYSFFMIT